MTTIYCDGHSLDITGYVGERLAAAAIIVPHPERGHEPFGFDDYTLAPGIEWNDIYAATKRYSPFHGNTWPAP